MKQAKSNSSRWDLEYKGISNRPGSQITEAGYFRYMEIRSQGYSLRWESDYGSQMMSEVTRGRVDNENNSQS